MLPEGDAPHIPVRKRLPLLPSLLMEDAKFRTFWYGQVVSLFGDEVTLLALPLVAVLILHAGADQMGYLAATGLAPNLLFALHAGAWVDRQGTRRHVMIAADLGRAVLLLTIPAAYALHHLTMVHLYVVAFLVGSLSMLFSVSQSAVFVSLVPRRRFVEGNQILLGSRAFSLMSGPSFAGILVQLFSAPYAIAADACSFLVSALFLGKIAPDEPPPAPRAPGQTLAGAHFIVESPIVRSVLASTASGNFFYFMFSALYVLYATRVLHLGPGTIGAIVGTAGVGAVVGAVTAGRLETRIGIGPAFILACALFPLALGLVPFAHGPLRVVLPVLFAGGFFTGLGFMILDISVASILAAATPNALRARVSGAYRFVNFGLRPLGSLAGGLLGSTIGLRPTLWIAAAGAFVAVLWLLPSPVRRIRTLEALPERAATAILP